MKIWQNGEFTKEASATMFAIAWVLGIIGLII